MSPRSISKRLDDLLTDFLLEDYESKSGDFVLGRVRGVFFVPNGTSRNKRYYPRQTWEKALEECKSRLEDGMLGTLLHPRTPEWAHPVWSSHVVKRLWIGEDDKGYGEAYVLDTPVGRVVNTFLRSGLVRLYVSSRAWGKTERQGDVEVVVPGQYRLEAFDFVLEPGFLEARPELVEEYGIDRFYEFEPLAEKVLELARRLEDG